MSVVSDVSLDDSEDNVKAIVTTNEFLELGLSIWYTQDRIRTFRTHETRISRFKEYYGVRPRLCADLFEDLQRTKIEEARIDDEDDNDHPLGGPLGMWCAMTLEKKKGTASEEVRNSKKRSPRLQCKLT